MEIFIFLINPVGVYSYSNSHQFEHSDFRCLIQANYHTLSVFTLSLSSHDNQIRKWQNSIFVDFNKNLRNTMLPNEFQYFDEFQIYPLYECRS